MSLSKVSAIALALCSSQFAFSLDYEIPEGASNYSINIATDEDVRITTTNPQVRLSGSIFTDGDIVIVNESGAKGDLWLNPDLVIDGFNEDLPAKLDISGMKFLEINTPIHVEGNIINWPGTQNGVVQINKPVVSETGLISISIGGGSGGRFHLNTGASIISHEGFVYLEEYESQFFSAPNTTISGKRAVTVRGGQISLAGPITSEGKIEVNGVKLTNSTGNVIIQNQATLTAENIDVFGGDFIQLMSDLTAEINVFISGNDIHLQGNTITAPNNLTFSSRYNSETVVNNFGATINAGSICVDGQVNGTPLPNDC